MNEFNNRKILSLEFGCLTDMGTLRQHNEDSFGFYQPSDPEILYEKGEMYLVANGYGGKNIGDVASRLAIDVITKEYYNQPITLSIEESLSHAFQLANKRIFDTMRHKVSHREAGASATCAIIQRSNVYVAHVGNGRLYEIKGYTIKQLTQDHVAAYESDTAIQQFRIGQRKYALTNVLGHDEILEPDIFTLKLRPGAHLLLCTDGLVNEVDNREIGRIVLKYSPQEACEQLIKTANAHGGSDNLTVIIIKIKGLKALSVVRQQSQVAGINLMPPAEEKKESGFSSATIRLSESLEEKATTPEVPPSTETPEDQETESKEVPDTEKKSREKPQEAKPAYYREYEKTDYQAPRGIQRRKIVLPEEKKKAIKINWTVVGFIVFGLLLAFTIIYILIQSRPAIRKLSENLESSLTTEKTSSKEQLPSGDRKMPIPTEESAKPSTSIEAIPKSVDTTITITTTSQKIARIVVVNGSMASTAKISSFINRLKSEKFEATELSAQRAALKIKSHSKIIYRPPFEESNIQIRNIAEKIRDIFSNEYNSKLEIVPCDLSIILGRDYNPKKVNILNMKRFRQFTDQVPDMLAKRVEILNGSGVSGIANNLRKDLDFLILDDDKTYLQIIDARNAISMKHSKTMIQCFSFENEVAQNIARVLGVSNPETRIVNENLNDMIVVLGKDFL